MKEKTLSPMPEDKVVTCGDRGVVVKREGH